MDFKVLQKTDRTLEIKVKDADSTVMYPLIEQLLKDEEVTTADYSVEHQELDDPILRIEVKEGTDPKEKLIDISKTFRDDIDGIYSDIFGEEEED
ncbi:MAG: RpoL/Rpb11 RNA polymerase subunit family protein [Candidatus Aenigmatarchaeota archaeon]